MSNMMDNSGVLKYEIRGEYGEIFDTIYYLPNNNEIANDPYGEKIIWHRIGLPANIHHDGDIGWWVHNINYDDVQKYCDACEFDGETTVYWLIKYGHSLPVHMDDI